MVNISVGVFAEDIQAISPVDTSTTSETRKGKYASWGSKYTDGKKKALVWCPGSTRDSCKSLAVKGN